MVNAPKKFNDKTKEWDKALEDDFKKIKKIKNFSKNFNSEDLLASIPEPEEVKAKFHKAGNSEDFVEVKKALPKDLKRRENVQLRGLGEFQPMLGNYSIKDSRSVPAKGNAEITITNESYIKKTLDKSVSSNGLMAFLSNDRNTSLNHSRSSKKLVDWQFYASIRTDPLSSRNHLNQGPIDDSSLHFSKQSVNQLVEQRRMRTKVLMELEAKRKFFNKPFQAASTDYSYINNIELRDSQEGPYEPPRFIKELNNKNVRKLKVKKKEKAPRKESVPHTDRASQEITLFLPKIYSNKVLHTARDL